MQRVQYHRYGGPAEMALEGYDLSEPGDDEIRVRVAAASINPVDWKIRQGKMAFMTGRKFPRGMGQDFSGIVEGIGRKVTRFAVGDAVFGGTPVKTSGAFADATITKESLAFAKPPALSFEDAATLPTAGATAWTALAGKAALKPGQTVFINGAHGAVGQAATQIARALGATVTARVAGDTMAAMKALGADATLDYRAPLPAGLQGTFDVVFDTHGGLTLAEGSELVRPRGVILDINPSPAKMLRILLSRRRRFVMARQDEATFREVAALAAAGRLGITIGRTVPLTGAIELVRSLEAGDRIGGKGVIVVDPAA